jgi:hypothetical protein
MTIPDITLNNGVAMPQLGFELDAADLEAIATLDSGKRLGPDPATLSSVG